ncbi:MAG: ADP-forming succinate--CoA ligase subunit beta [Euryarchaeota archaeon]|nr:ADP-forming succinate--CoA ligase subunit beta [Euryarchaeota archaeon]
MKLLEYQGKQLFRDAGIPIPKGAYLPSLDTFDTIKDRLSYPAVVKAQVLIGGRGKAGGIQFADNDAEAKAQAKKIIGMDIKGHEVKSVYIEEKLDIDRELYVSCLIDRTTRKTLMLFSAEGGIEIESVPEDKIAKVYIDPLTGFSQFHARQALAVLPDGYSKDERKQLAKMLGQLYDAFRSFDCELLEINPLAITKDGQVIAADSKAIINDAAKFRQKKFEEEASEYTELEKEANAQGIAFIQLDGTIGVIANGAGLTMATLDALNEYGGNAGVFLDLGGTDDPDQVARAMRLMKKAKPSLILVNLFGGITKCDTVAKGIREVFEKEGLDCPVVTRIKGTNEKEAKEILKDAGFITTNTLQDAAKKCSELEKQQIKEVA